MKFSTYSCSYLKYICNFNIDFKYGTLKFKFKLLYEFAMEVLTNNHKRFAISATPANGFGSYCQECRQDFNFKSQPVNCVQY